MRRKPIKVLSLTQKVDLSVYTDVDILTPSSELSISAGTHLTELDTIGATTSWQKLIALALL